MAPTRESADGQAIQAAPKRRDARANLARIMAAAARVYAVEGLTATLADVAKEAGVGVGTVYRTFPSKDDLIHDVYAPHLEEIEERAAEASRAEDPWSGVVGFLELSIPELARDRGFRELLSGAYTASLGWSRPKAPHRLRELVASSHQRSSAHLAVLVRRAQERGQLRADFDTTDLLVLAMSVQTAVGFGGPGRPGLYRRAIGIILDGLCVARDRPSPLPASGLAEVGALGTTAS
ncbi:helix-turn-helix domain-containing protein [Amycolatopsis minnesotensis]|uniref:HTH tetR-type domain-containing protein n=1 Tax=Amycolatopsis minnesotensis TaxID=337894 RepID=A0ABN2PZD2_9PSEU